jgi:hypothetical protein
MLGRIIGLLVTGSLFGIGYVLFNGIGDDYQLFGDAGQVMSGGAVIMTGLGILTGLGGLLFIRAGLGGAGRTSILAGLAMLAFAVWGFSFSDARSAREPVVMEPSSPDTVLSSSSAACYQFLVEKNAGPSFHYNPDGDARRFADFVAEESGDDRDALYEGCREGFARWAANQLNTRP